MARGARAGGVLDTTLLAICVLSSFVVLFLPAPLRDQAAAALRRTAVAPLAELQRYAELRRAAFLSYDARITARGAAVRDSADASALRVENASLRRMLGLASRLQWGFVAAEAVPNQLAGELVETQIMRTFMVTAGSRVGIAPYTPIVTAEGLVGMVSQQVDPAMSLAISYLDEDFRVSAMTADASAFGIVQPHLGRGAERGLLEIHGVPFRTALKPGTLIVSSGLGATYPRGVPIGTVLREISTPEKWARTYLIQPAVPLASVGPVFLLLRPRLQAGVDSVWTSISAADAAARAAATAGDSLARDALLREAAARRAALDSTRPDSTAGDSTRTDSTRVDSASAPPAAATPVPVTPPARDSVRRAPATARDSLRRPVPPRPAPAAAPAGAPPSTAAPRDTARRPARPTVPPAPAGARP